jgi:hypothetical protein
VEAREAKLSELSGPKYMKRDEFKAYAAALRTKTTTFKTLKTALGEARQESVVLARTEALLRARATDIDAFMRKLEEKKGIAGYTGVASSLEEVSALKSRVDESKGKTLEEIARIVSDIQSAIAERKTRLAPQMTALRAARSAFAEMETAYVHERAKYENVASGLESEKAALERTADALAADATAEEGRAALCAAQGAIVDALIVRANDEAAFEAGEGRFVRDFKTQKELFANKLAQVRGRLGRGTRDVFAVYLFPALTPPPPTPRHQLDGLAKEFRRKQKDLKENSTGNVFQRARYLDLAQLLKGKVRHYKTASRDWANAGVDGKVDDVGANVWRA